MPASDPWLRRQNDALKLRGLAVTLELCGSRVRLRASMPPKPEDTPSSPWKQQRISTGLEYPAQAREAVELAETLGRSLERHRMGFEAFDWSPWERKGRQRRPATAVHLMPSLDPRLCASPGRGGRPGGDGDVQPKTPGRLTSANLWQL